MRKGGIVIAALIAVGVAYGLYWHWAARLLERSLADWTEQWRAEGYQIAYRPPQVRGFPLTLRADLGRFEIQAPPGERTWQWRPVSASLALQAQPWRPLAFRIAAQGTHRLELIAGKQRRPIDVYLNEGSAEIDLSPAGRPEAIDFDAKLVEISASGNMVRLEGASGRVTLFALETPDHGRASAAFALAIDEVTLPAPPDLPIGDRLREVGLEGEVMGVIPIGLLAPSLARWRDGGGTVELAHLAAAWGPLSLDGSGTLALDGALQPLLAASAFVRGYGAAIDAAVAGGYLRPDRAAAAKLVLAAMAQPGTDGPMVKVPLTVQDRALFVGPLRLVELPRIEWW